VGTLLDELFSLEKELATEYSSFRTLHDLLRIFHPKK
jgi:hypothetical protein